MVAEELLIIPMDVVGGGKTESGKSLNEKDKDKDEVEEPQAKRKEEENDDDDFKRDIPTTSVKVGGTFGRSKGRAAGKARRALFPVDVTPETEEEGGDVFPEIAEGQV